MAEINVVPYIDVMLVLLVIFMMTAPILNQGVTVSLPQTQHAQSFTEEDLPFVVSIDRTGQFYLSQGIANAEPMSLDILVTRLLAEKKLAPHSQRGILIKADSQIDYGKVIKLMDALKGVGISQLGLVTEGDHARHA